jgi:hypothetical protein
LALAALLIVATVQPVLFGIACGFAISIILMIADGFVDSKRAIKP